MTTRPDVRAFFGVFFAPCKAARDSRQRVPDFVREPGASSSKWASFRWCADRGVALDQLDTKRHLTMRQYRSRLEKHPAQPARPAIPGAPAQNEAGTGFAAVEELSPRHLVECGR